MRRTRRDPRQTSTPHPPVHPATNRALTALKERPHGGVGQHPPRRSATLTSDTGDAPGTRPSRPGAYKPGTRRTRTRRPRRLRLPARSRPRPRTSADPGTFPPRRTWDRARISGTLPRRRRLRLRRSRRHQPRGSPSSLPSPPSSSPLPRLARRSHRTTTPPRTPPRLLRTWGTRGHSRDPGTSWARTAGRWDTAARQPCRRIRRGRRAPWTTSSRRDRRRRGSRRRR